MGALLIPPHIVNVLSLYQEQSKLGSILIFNHYAELCTLYYFHSYRIPRKVSTTTPTFTTANIAASAVSITNATILLKQQLFLLLFVITTYYYYYYYPYYSFSILNNLIDF